MSVGRYKKRTFLKLQNVLLGMDWVDFDYSDSPENHGWDVKYKGAPEPTIATTKDGRWGRVLQIQSNLAEIPPTPETPNYHMDYQVPSRSQKKANHVKFIFKPGAWYLLYVKVGIRNNGGTMRKEVWLNFRIGDRPPRRHPDYPSEWLLDLQKEWEEEKWVTSIAVDLREAVKDSFGTEGTGGWEFERLIGFRIRGDMHLAKILYFFKL